MSLRIGGLFPVPFRGLDDAACFQIFGGNADGFDGAILDDFDRLKVRGKTAKVDAGGLQTNTTGLFGNTAPGDGISHARLSSREITNPRHSVS